MSTGLSSIDVRSGVNENGRGFCTVVATSTDRSILIGQLSPEKVREMALTWLQAAEAADQDAAVLRCVRRLEMPDELAGAIVTELRHNRTEQTDD